MQAQTSYSDKTVTNYKMCAEDLDNFTYSNCSYTKDLIMEYNLTCENATTSVRHVSVGTREGMNILGIIVFSIAFAVVLSRMGEEGRRVVGVISTLNEAIMKLVSLVMW